MRLLFLFLFSAGLALLVARAANDEPMQQQLFLPHCTGSSWYTVETDADSVTVRCYPHEPDQGQE